MKIQSAGELPACDFLPVHSAVAFPGPPPQSAAGLNNAVPISTPILHSNSCLLVFPSSSLSRLCGRNRTDRHRRIKPPRRLNTDEQFVNGGRWRDEQVATSGDAERLSDPPRPSGEMAQEAKTVCKRENKPERSLHSTWPLVWGFMVPTKPRETY